MSSSSGSGRSRPFEVAFVCTGNRARSPLALELFRTHARGAGFSAGSFGTLDLGPVPALPEAVTAGLAVGVDLSRHRARPIVPGCLADVDLVVGFEPFHVSWAIVEGGAPAERTFTLPELAGLLEATSLPEGLSGTERARLGVAEAGRLRDADGSMRAPALADPLGKPLKVFVQLSRQIDVLAARLADALFGRPAAATTQDEPTGYSPPPGRPLTRPAARTNRLREA